MKRKLNPALILGVIGGISAGLYIWLWMVTL